VPTMVDPDRCIDQDGVHQGTSPCRRVCRAGAELPVAARRFAAWTRTKVFGCFAKRVGFVQVRIGQLHGLAHSSSSPVTVVLIKPFCITHCFVLHQCAHRRGRSVNIR